MKAFAKKLIERNYTKRIIAILIAAGILLVATAILIPTTLHKQISEFRALEQAQEEQEKQQDATSEGVTEGTATGTVEGKETHKRDGKEHEIKAILRQLTPVGIGVKIAFAAVALLAFLLGIFYWITVAEWLYKMAVLNGLNRALWPMLGLVGNILVLPVLLIVLCDPRRVGKQVA